MGRGEATPASSPYPPTSTRLTRRNVVNRVGSTVLKQDVRALWKIAANDLIGIGDSFEVPGELGGFLLQSVKTGQLLGLYGSIRINEAALGAMSDRSYVYTANVDDGVTFETIIIDDTPGDGPGSYLNMSFTQPANVGIVINKETLFFRKTEQLTKIFPKNIFVRKSSNFNGKSWNKFRNDLSPML